MRKHAFTLIELLVVVAIISLLAAILFPVFAAAREKARQSSCQSNLKQIGVSIIQYVQDNDEMMPHSVETDNVAADAACWGTPSWYAMSGTWVTWMDLVGSYTKNTQIFYCPDFALPNVSGYPNGYGYAPNDNIIPPIWAPGRMNGYPACTPKTQSGVPFSPFNRLVASIDLPSTIVMMGERGYPSRSTMYFDTDNATSPATAGPNATYPDPAGIYLNSSTTGTGDAPLGFHHTQMSNFLFCDGHVKAEPYSLAFLQGSFGTEIYPTSENLDGNW